MQRDRVRDYFNSLASGWQSKYGSAGSMVARKPRFEATLRRLVPPPAQVLDYGCGSGNIAAHFAECGYEVTGCDIAEEMIQVARHSFADKNITWTWLEANAPIWPFPTNSFDAIFSSSVFEYIEDLDAIFAECARVLKPQGVLVVTIPDPKNGLRQIENLIRPFAMILRKVPWPWSDKFLSYFEYLHLSKNRFSVRRWIDLAASHQLKLESMDANTEPLRMLAFRAFAKSADAITKL